jgi:hypothetical protein
MSVPEIKEVNDEGETVPSLNVIEWKKEVGVT